MKILGYSFDINCEKPFYTGTLTIQLASSKDTDPARLRKCIETLKNHLELEILRSMKELNDG